MFNVFSKIINGDCLDSLKEEERKKFNSFMLCRYLSGSSKTIMLSNIINLNFKIPDNCQSILVSNFCKNNNIRFIKYPKTSMEKINVDDLMKKYNISREKALDYYYLLNNKK